MNIEELHAYCLAKKGVVEAFPFDEEVLVFKAIDKIFLLVNINTRPLQFNVKCDPEKAIALREQYDAIIPGYHMNKVHWNTVIDDGSIPTKLVLEQIDHSYDLIVKSLTKTKQQLLKSL